MCAQETPLRRANHLHLGIRWRLHLTHACYVVRQLSHSNVYHIGKIQSRWTNGRRNPTCHPIFGVNRHKHIRLVEYEQKTHRVFSNPWSSNTPSGRVEVRGFNPKFLETRDERGSGKAKSGKGEAVSVLASQHLAACGLSCHKKRSNVWVGVCCSREESVIVRTGQPTETKAIAAVVGWGKFRLVRVRTSNPKRW